MGARFGVVSARVLHSRLRTWLGVLPFLFLSLGFILGLVLWVLSVARRRNAFRVDRLQRCRVTSSITSPMVCGVRGVVCVSFVVLVYLVGAHRAARVHVPAPVLSVLRFGFVYCLNTHSSTTSSSPTNSSFCARCLLLRPALCTYCSPTAGLVGWMLSGVVRGGVQHRSTNVGLATLVASGRICVKCVGLAAVHDLGFLAFTSSSGFTSLRIRVRRVLHAACACVLASIPLEAWMPRTSVRSSLKH